MSSHAPPWTVSHPQRLVIAIAKSDVQAQEVEKYLADIFAQGCGPYRKMFDVSQTDTAFDESVLKGFAFVPAPGPSAPTLDDTKTPHVSATDGPLTVSVIFGTTTGLSRPL